MKQKYLKPIFVVTQWLGIIAFAIYSTPQQATANDIKLYYKAAISILDGQLPYRDFAFEYPPLALLPMTIPQLINPGGFGIYRILFVLQNIGYVFAIAFLLRKFLDSWQKKQEFRVRLRFYLTVVALLSPLLLWRYDLFATTLTLWSLWLVFNNFSLIAGILLGLSIAAKLYPIVFIPAFSLYYLTQRKIVAGMRFIAGMIWAISLTTVPFLLLENSQLWSFFDYHQGRGLQIESLASGLLLLAEKFNLTTTEVVFDYGAYHLQSSLGDNILKSSSLTYLFILWSLLLSLYCYGNFRGQQLKQGKISDRSLILFITVALLIMIVVNKVFSPQYLIWLLPFVVLLQKRDRIIFLIICLATILIYPLLYFQLLDRELLPILILNFRNSLLIMLSIFLLKDLLPR